MACCCELQNTLDVEVTQDALLDVEIGGSAGVLLQAKSVEVTENGTSVVAPDDGFDGLKSVEINTNVPKRFECGDAVFDTNAYNGSSLEISKRITKINISCLVTAQTTSTKQMFHEFSKLTDIVGLDNWDTSNVTNMKEMFYGCKSFRQLDVSYLDTSSVTNMRSMFHECNSLKQLDASFWDTSNVTDVTYLFANCYNLMFVDLSGWYLGKATNGVDTMFWASINNVRTLIGKHTLQDVENGLKTMIGLALSFNIQPGWYVRFSSILALANGLADLTGATAQTLTISKYSYNNMYIDDDTVPTADVIAERKARIAAICAAKNWNFAH